MIRTLTRDLALKRIRKRLRAQHQMLRQCRNGSYMILGADRSVVLLGVSLEDLVERYHVLGSFEVLEPE